MIAITVKPKNKKEYTAIKKVLKVLNIESEDVESPYNPDFVKKILEGDEEYKQGKFKVIKTEDLWK